MIDLPECFFNNCCNCPGVENAKTHLLTQMENNGIDDIHLKKMGVYSTSNLRNDNKEHE